MAAVHTVSSNGVETSPVTRGVFVSENILGVIPPPPPDEVPAIEPDVRGAKTRREILAKHSNSKPALSVIRLIRWDLAWKASIRLAVGGISIRK